MIAVAICFMLFWQLDRRAVSRTTCTAGKSIPTRMPMTAITTSSSTSVKPFDAKRILKMGGLTLGLLNSRTTVRKKGNRTIESDQDDPESHRSGGDKKTTHERSRIPGFYPGTA
jgi:hypothetical protein